MSDQDLTQAMDQEWQKVRSDFYYPSLPHPELIETDEEGSGSFEFDNLRTKIWKNYVESFRGTDLSDSDKTSDELSLNECLTHEVTHYMKFPGSVLNILRLQKTAQQIVDEEKASRLRTDFVEAQTNLELMLTREHPATEEISRQLASRGSVPSPSGQIMWGLYQESTGYDLEISLSDEEKDLVGKLKEVNYLDKESEQKNFRQFVEVLKDYQPPKDQSSKDGNSDGRSNGGGLEGFSDNEIREGLKQFAQECDTPEEYSEVIGQVFSEGNDKGSGKENTDRKSRLIAGSGQGVERLARNFYTALAERYTVPIRRKQMHKSGGLYPHSHTSFTVGDSINEVDAFSTPGVFPGITKKWIKRDGEVCGDAEAVPDSFIVIDNSGSMPDPEDGLSVPVLGGTAISNAYFNNDSRVAVYNFGGGDYLLQPTRNREEVHKQLRIYTGGGTTFNPTHLKKVLRENDREFDVTVISDMDIYNLGFFVSSITSIPQTHRVHLLYTDSSARGLKSKFRNKNNVAVLPLIRESDIEKITMGELAKSVR